MSADCATCVHSRPVISDEDDDLILKCHRFPATLLVCDGELIQSFPDAAEACGEWTCE